MDAAEVLLDLVGEVQGLLDLDEFRSGLILGLARAVPSDWISINDLGPEPETAVVLIEPTFPPESHELFARLAHENPLIQRYQQTLDGRAYRFSDVIGRKDLRALALYREFYGPIGLEHQIAFTLPHAPNRLLGVALSRRDRDYSDDERDLLNRSRPFLIQSYRNAIEYTALRAQRDDPYRHLEAALADRGLTRREVEVLRAIATGRSNLAVAGILGVSERTVQKHLERVYRKLAVGSRSEAATLVWSLVGDR
jgi:DNA-binding CsgD family transcriptional regulator